MESLDLEVIYTLICSKCHFIDLICFKSYFTVVIFWNWFGYLNNFLFIYICLKKSYKRVFKGKTLCFKCTDSQWLWKSTAIIYTWIKKPYIRKWEISKRRKEKLQNWAKDVTENNLWKAYASPVSHWTCNMTIPQFQPLKFSNLNYWKNNSSLKHMNYIPSATSSAPDCSCFLQVPPAAISLATWSPIFWGFEGTVSP